ncbi:50S ribosomal subunit protein L3 [Candidatus Competibacter denitrificans Run_A_D11]|jgi:large subunit ribosomal protein L3|uniref:Large ribosomal subunit protein uL3 n=1 Tax=Candidatus Competibacter denitrificans Run_A_D11 TaxID=1400863 RepID=W6M5U1_9GAMM|nr:50S ribosomal protein L3 [Candidatus Competibacter denitrificans]CDI01984.1 50S ribosomal subunit protein L3 [Candidatus Competibacter denitrificans Run_A_D11]HAS87392.1 50S ribosomal protein L3 [Candidatus Competibacteraceae bacterium]HRC70726.1 50S ribosomal protein L3 [Candidatus Competibacter denitrificans]
MAIGLVGRKAGMTRVFTEDGVSIPVTLIEVEPNRVTQVKTEQTDGYRALQVTVGSRRPSRVTKPMVGHFAKAGVAPGRGLWEFRLNGDEGAEIAVGAELKVDVFQTGQKVDVTGTTIGKGFAGAIKRHHFRSQRATHGNSLSHRAPGSIGQNQSPGRVFKGKKMSGHLGAAQRCVQNLEVIRVDVERNLLAIKGAVPGAKGGDVLIRPAVKVRR